MKDDLKVLIYTIELEKLKAERLCEELEEKKDYAQALKFSNLVIALVTA